MANGRCTTTTAAATSATSSCVAKGPRVCRGSVAAIAAGSSVATSTTAAARGATVIAAVRAKVCVAPLAAKTATVTRVASPTTSQASATNTGGRVLEPAGNAGVRGKVRATAAHVEIYLLARRNSDGVSVAKATTATRAQVVYRAPASSPTTDTNDADLVNVRRDSPGVRTKRGVLCLPSRRYAGAIEVLEAYRPRRRHTIVDCLIGNISAATVILSDTVGRNTTEDPDNVEEVDCTT